MRAQSGGAQGGCGAKCLVEEGAAGRVVGDEAVIDLHGLARSGLVAPRAGVGDYCLDELGEQQHAFAGLYAYTIFVFFYGAVLLAVVQFVYFAYVDHGYLLSSFSKLLSTEEGRALVSQYGMTQMVEDGLAEMASIRPIDYALNILTVNIIVGFILGFPIGLVMQRRSEK